MTPVQNSSIKKNSGLGFPFTEHDLIRIDIAKVGAIHFMRSYGKGRKPRMIDRSRYISLLPVQPTPTNTIKDEHTDSM